MGVGGGQTAVDDLESYGAPPGEPARLSQVRLAAKVDGPHGGPRGGHPTTAASRFSSIVRSKTKAYSSPAPTAVYGQMK